MSVGLGDGCGGGGGGGAGSGGIVLSGGAGGGRRTVGGFGPADGTHSGSCRRRHGSCPVCGDGGDGFGLGLKSRAADEVMSFPVFVLAEGPAVAGGVAAAARLAGFAATIPATLREKKEKMSIFHHPESSIHTKKTCF